MSSYKKLTKHPETGVIEKAWWLDDYFGHYRYGVEFPDGQVFDPMKIKMETFEREQPRIPEEKED